MPNTNIHLETYSATPQIYLQLWYF